MGIIICLPPPAPDEILSSELAPLPFEADPPDNLKKQKYMHEFFFCLDDCIRISISKMLHLQSKTKNDPCYTKQNTFFRTDKRVTLNMLSVLYWQNTLYIFSIIPGEF